MELKNIGEFGFIKRFAHKFDDLISKGEMGIGDDCALIPLNDIENYVVTTDLLIENIHFLKERITPEELGHKSLAVNLSDIAAMGSEPKFSFLSLGIPKQTSIEYLNAFMNGYKALSKKYHTPLMGGDTTKSPDKLMINVVVVGQCKKSDVRLRSMAKEGDLICVTGFLGDSPAGLNILLNNVELNQKNKLLVQKHHVPEPRIKEGIWLAKQNSVHAMMDISDGISSDLMHILNTSGKSADIHIEKLPVSETMRNVAKEYAWSEIELATSGGEDYELLFTIDRKEIDNLKKAYVANFLEDITVIGEIKKGDTGITWLKNGNEITINKGGYDHFTNS